MFPNPIIWSSSAIIFRGFYPHFDNAHLPKKHQLIISVTNQN